MFSSGESELFEFCSVDDALMWIETPKFREHDCELAGCDYSPAMKILVTADKKGAIRIWSKDKKFLREIALPDQIDSVCFLNDQGDLLVSHNQRISKIEFSAYWTKTFDYFGVTRSKDDPTLAPIALEC